MFTNQTDKKKYHRFKGNNKKYISKLLAKNQIEKTKVKFGVFESVINFTAKLEYAWRFTDQVNSKSLL